MRGSWALVTGASAGIGAATAKALAQKGVNVVITGRRADRLTSLAAELGKSVKVKTLGFDIRDREETERALATLDCEISILVNNAGLALGTEKMNAANIDDWEAMIDTNVKGLLYVTRFFLPKMLARAGGKGEGHIVNIGSVAGRWTYPGGGVYAATKFAVRALSDSLRMDLMGKKIRVTNIEPGMVETEFSKVRFKGDTEKADNVYKGINALTARDIAETVVWCVERPAHVNIQELVIFPVDQVGVGPSYTHRENS